MNMQPSDIADKKPWDRLPEESPVKYTSFMAYLSLGPDRTIAQAAENTGRTSGYLLKVSAQYNWVERAGAFDEYQAKAQQKALVDVAYDTVYEQQIHKDRTLREAARIAYADPRRVAQWDSNGLVLKNSNELSEEEAAAIKKIKFSKKQGSVEIELHDKLKAVELLGKNQKLWNEDERQATTNNYAVVIAAVQKGEYDDLLRRAFPGIELPQVNMFGHNKEE